MKTETMDGWSIKSLTSLLPMPRTSAASEIALDQHQLL
jgi:hypothetical protein